MPRRRRRGRRRPHRGLLLRLVLVGLPIGALTERKRSGWRGRGRRSECHQTRRHPRHDAATAARSPLATAGRNAAGRAARRVHVCVPPVGSGVEQGHDLRRLRGGGPSGVIATRPWVGPPPPHHNNRSTPVAHLLIVEVRARDGEQHDARMLARLPLGLGRVEDLTRANSGVTPRGPCRRRARGAVGAVARTLRARAQCLPAR